MVGKEGKKWTVMKIQSHCSVFEISLQWDQKWPVANMGNLWIRFPV